MFCLVTCLLCFFSSFGESKELVCSKEKQTDNFLNSRSFSIVFYCSHDCLLKISGFEPSVFVKCYFVVLSFSLDEQTLRDLKI